MIFLDKLNCLQNHCVPFPLPGLAWQTREYCERSNIFSNATEGREI